MTVGRTILAILLFPWRVLRFIAATARALLLSARAWVLFVLALIVLFVAYYAVSDRYTPFTTDAYVQAFVIQVAAQVEGQVIKVHVSENQEVKKGELLFEIDPRPFAHRVALLEAKLAQAVQSVAQLGSDLEAAKADEARIAADEAYAKAVFEQDSSIFKQSATTERRYLDSMQKYRAAQAAREKSKASISKVEQALAAKVGDEHALVAEVKAQLADAKLNLEWTRIYAPATGRVTNVQLREGAYSHVGKPVLTVIDTDRWWVVANFRENSLERIRKGQPAGITFNTYPGRVFSGTVESIGWGVSEGQGVPSGELPAVRNPVQWIRLAQRFQVRIAADLPEGHPWRVGATTTVTVYTEETHWLNSIAAWWQQVIAYFDYLY